jgi:hypothetical protein
LAAEARYVVEVHLKSGGFVEELVSEEQADELAASGRFIWPSDREHDQAWKQRAAITTILSERMEKGSGLLTMVDAEGKQWLIQTSNIAAANIRDRAESPDTPEVQRGPIGFEPLILQRTATGQAQTQIE